ncbi:hypothetical protein WG66_011600 [Moniliophthora roreri]|uniref:DUF6533 domain-containing protein n=1 Tax=Moniliophthora roreri TaxID=221103 RepID=A0A0W0FKR3_MONRR|nr:hypothetical protein WG66_011600 [Moniliophthora roreri]
MVSELISGVLSVVETTKYAELAASTIILFDHLITLDDEVELIWKSSWSIGKVLFFINRYYTLASVIINNYALFGASVSDSVSATISSPHTSSALMFDNYSCHRFFYWQGSTGLFACMIAEIILQMRLYALYFLNRRVLAIMVTTFILTSASAAAIMGVVLSGVEAKSKIPFIPTTFCFPSNVPHYFYAFWIPILTFETVLCSLALFRGYQTFRTSGSPFQSGQRLIGVLIRDSVVYFLVMFATYLTNLLVWVWDINYLEVTVGFSVAMSCVLGNRVIINVRQVNKEMETEKKSRERTNSVKKSKIPEPEPVIDCDTLTDIEMAQLRTMRVDYEYLQEVEADN